jgi:acyl-CoA reductase-like NAD-dependent aldehyde dehydrogenase
LIPNSKVDEFVDCCRNILYTRFGTDPKKSDSFCRIISERRFDALKRYLDELDPKTIVVGGQTDKKDLYIAPTIVCPLEPKGTLLMEEEIFGPILPIVPVQDVDEAIHIVNSK